MTLPVPKMQMCPSVEELDLRHFRDFQTDLGLSAGWKTFHIHYQIRLVYSHSRVITVTVPDMIFTPSASGDFFSGLWWNSLQLHDSRAIHIITGRTKHFSGWRNSISTCNLSLRLFLTYEDTSGSHLLHIHHLVHLHITLLLHFLNMAPSLPWDCACCCSVHPFSSLSCIWSSAFRSETHQPPVGSPVFRTPGGEVRSLSITKSVHTQQRIPRKPIFIAIFYMCSFFPQKFLFPQTVKFYFFRLK